jgi:hypothetical protein
MLGQIKMIVLFPPFDQTLVATSDEDRYEGRGLDY